MSKKMAAVLCGLALVLGLILVGLLTRKNDAAVLPANIGGTTKVEGNAPSPGLVGKQDPLAGPAYTNMLKVAEKMGDTRACVEVLSYYANNESWKVIDENAAGNMSAETLAAYSLWRQAALDRPRDTQAAFAAANALAAPANSAPANQVATKYPESALQEYMGMDPSQWKSLPQGLQDQLAEYAKTHAKTATEAPAAK